MDARAPGFFFSPMNNASVTFNSFNRVEVRSKNLTRPVEFDRDIFSSIHQQDSASRKYTKRFANMLKLAGQTYIFSCAKTTVAIYRTIGIARMGYA